MNSLNKHVEVKKDLAGGVPVFKGTLFLSKHYLINGTVQRALGLGERWIYPPYNFLDRLLIIFWNCSLCNSVAGHAVKRSIATMMPPPRTKAGIKK